MEVIKEIRWSLKFWHKLTIETISKVMESKLSTCPMIGGTDMDWGPTGVCGRVVGKRNILAISRLEQPRSCQSSRKHFFKDFGEKFIFLKYSTIICLRFCEDAFVRINTLDLAYQFQLLV